MASHEPGTVENQAESLVGRLLVATPALQDPNFERTVVLLVSHEPAGALGVVLNRATEVPVAEVLGDWSELTQEPAVLFEGGPVQPEAAIALGWMRSGAGEPSCFKPFAGRLGTLDLSADPDTLSNSLDGMRVFAGYASWDADQLKDEIKEGAWMVFDSLPGDPFASRPEDLWAMVWRRQGGLLAAVAHYPADPSHN
ncbi:MAG TPA: YqgE/AlgH family protein [Stackebrandtia sp.]|uniref:YqgE/AlgH family protein n=1 Tax=Stackebrandtia sp. TaxID=2023065 RepID=UPI002D3F85B5|nr:YqgE/AlgH family protein [Stackebrandtia sp.]HZE40757.1 YqgE/AlgH family protein [Stackebrandtia sp.]